jgi:hypothetical protein
MSERTAMIPVALEYSKSKNPHRGPSLIPITIDLSNITARDLINAVREVERIGSDEQVVLVWKQYEKLTLINPDTNIGQYATVSSQEFKQKEAAANNIFVLVVYSGSENTAHLLELAKQMGDMRESVKDLKSLKSVIGAIQ